MTKAGLAVLLGLGLIGFADLNGSPAFALGRAAPVAELPTVDHLDLNAYQGLWYEIVRLPQRFERGCTGVTAEYRLLNNGRVRVINTCRKGSLEGPVKSVRGTARVVDAETQAKLKVTFFWPFSGDYWVLELGPRYEYAVVGSPDRSSLWVLSRTPQMSESLLESILERRAAQGFDISRIEKTPQ